MALQTNLLRGEKVYLTAQTKDDQKHYVEWGKNIDYIRMLITDEYRPPTLERQEEWYAKSYKSDTFIPFAIRTVEADTLIGFTNLMDINWQSRTCWLAIGIGDPNYWGGGYGSDTLRVLLRYAFMEVNMNRVGLAVSDYNPRGIKAYEKVGFVYEGIERQYLWRDGQFHDAIVMSVLREEWDTQQL